MAENKKSFVLYCDLIHTIKHLTDEQAGNLFKHVLMYVNDENPISENPITNIAFEPIKQQLKRDLKKWEGKTEQWSDAGINSALSKFKTKLSFSNKQQTKDLTTDINQRLANDKDNIYLQQALILCNERSTELTNVGKRSTESTVTDTVNVTVTVNDINNIKKEILNSNIWIESICKNKMIDLKTCYGYLETFLNDAELKDELNDLSDSKKHFVNWLNIKLKDKPKEIIKPVKYHETFNDGK